MKINLSELGDKVDAGETIDPQVLKETLEDYAETGSRIHPHIVIKIISHTALNSEDRNTLVASARKGYQSKTDLGQTIAADEYKAVIEHLLGHGSIIDRAVAHNLVAQIIVEQVWHLTRIKSHDLNTPTYHQFSNFLTDFAREAARMAIVKPFAYPDFVHSGWQQQFADAACDAMDEQGFEALVARTSEAMEERFAGVRNGANPYKWLYKIALHSGQTARMVWYGLDPNLLKSGN